MSEFLATLKAKASEDRTVRESRRASFNPPPPVAAGTRRPSWQPESEASASKAASSSSQQQHQQQQQQRRPSWNPLPDSSRKRGASFQPPDDRPVKATTSGLKGEEPIVEKKSFVDRVMTSVTSTLSSSSAAASSAASKEKVFPEDTAVAPRFSDVYGRLGKPVSPQDEAFEVANPMSGDASGRRLEEWKLKQSQANKKEPGIPEAYLGPVGATSTLDAATFLSTHKTRGGQTAALRHGGDDGEQEEEEEEKETEEELQQRLERERLAELARLEAERVEAERVAALARKQAELERLAQEAQKTTAQEMEGTLFKKTGKGVWHPRTFKLANRTLMWLRSDNKTTNALSLVDGEVRDVKFGTRKFAFDVADSKGDTIHLCASGEAEKTLWLTALNLAVKPEQSVKTLRASLHAGKAGRVGKLAAENGAKMILGLTGRPPAPRAGPSALPPEDARPSAAAAPPSAAVVQQQQELAKQAASRAGTPMMASQQANDRLQARLGGSLTSLAPAEELCVVCEKRVFAMDKVVLGEKRVLHKACFRCAHCHVALVPSNFVLHELRVYCRADYELVKKSDVELLLSASTATPSTTLDNSAALSKPRIGAGKRRAPSVMPQTMAPKAGFDEDRATSSLTFRVAFDGHAGSANELWMHASSKAERDQWIQVLGACVHALELKHALKTAQKTDMMAAIRAQVELEHFLEDVQVEYSGFCEKRSIKSKRNWKRRFFVLTSEGKLSYSESDASKKPKNTVQLTHLTVVSTWDGTRTNAPLILE